MAKYVPDIKTQRWVIIAPARIHRPGENGNGNGGAKPAGCPFCVGHESLTPPEVYRIGPGEKDKPGWLVRVVPNKFPITDIHEVIIHSPDDTKDIEELPLDQVVRILTAYRDRYLAHQDSGNVLIFCNHGLDAGASLKHPHSQLAVIPKQINLDTLVREPIANIVSESSHFTTYCPDFSQWPYEVWIAPKDDGVKFGQIRDEELADLALTLQTTLKKLAVVATTKISGLSIQQAAFVYNYYIYHKDNWYVRITPRLVHRAGFELGTGLSVNIIDPMRATEVLRQVNVS